MKAQMAFEYMVMLAIFLGAALIFIALFSDEFQIFQSESDKDNTRFWLRQQIAIASINVEATQTEITIVNNHRENISMNNISLNGRNLNITDKIVASGAAKQFNSSKTNFYGEVSVLFNYSIGSSEIVFTGNDVNFKGVKR